MPNKAQEEWYEKQRERRNQRQRYVRARNAEKQYAIRLRGLADQIGKLVNGFDLSDPAIYSVVEGVLRDYARIIRPWALATATTMLADVSNRDAAFWRQHSREMGIALREEIQSAPTGDLMRQLLADQVTLITSIPLDAAQRVHDIAIAGITEGSRGGEIIQQLMASGEVSRSRATLIARTETARTAANLSQARAEWIGSEGYIWRNVGDADVRPALGIKGFSRLNTLARGSHRKLEGTYHRWDEPPIAGTNGERAHPGCIYNCRCFAEPVFPKRMAA